MTAEEHPYRSEFARRHFDAGKAQGKAQGMAEGMAEGMASALLRVLGWRGVEVSDEHRAIIAGCTDHARL
jgi:flagellar biosynthesis/type III secretory pathway protein FliH